MATTDADLARELRATADRGLHGNALCGDIMRRAADALESKLAADREALAEACAEATSASYGTPHPELTILWAERPEVDKKHFRRIADRLFASGVIVRVPTREELVALIESHSPKPSAYYTGSGLLADAVLALIGVKGDG